MTEFDYLLGSEPAAIDTRSEKAIQNDMLSDLSALPDSLFFRNNTGQAYQGEKVLARIGSRVTVEPGMVILRKARPVKFGLPGSADILGAYRRCPVAVEVKDRDGRQSTQQRNFEVTWNRAGGIYVVARSPAE